jgi:3-keto-L-gulonate-6-phosphate decarboxylase
MHLLKTAGNGSAIGEPSAYRLIDFCVRSIAATAGGSVETAMTQLAALAELELPHLLPSQLGPPTRPGPEALASTLSSPQPLLPLLQTAASGAVTFAHDAIREYLLATRLAQLIEEHGRSSATINALNDLATQARRSATSHGVLEFTIQCLDSSAPDLLSALSLSPSIAITTTLPLMLEMAGDDPAFATDEVLRSCTSRSLHDSGLNLAKALLRFPRLAPALAEHHARWLLGVLRQFGSNIWAEALAYTERHLSASSLRGLLEAADFTDTPDAVFFARHAGVFFSDDPNLAGQLKTLLEHPDWRVRAALADGMRHHPTPHPAADAVLDVLARDRDYKVRAAIAEALGHLRPATTNAHARELALDDNWHVRERLIRGLTSVAIPVLDEQLRSILTTNTSWRECPAHVRTSTERLLLITAAPPTQPTQAYHKALFGLIREIRTGSLAAPHDVQTRLIDLARRSANWLVAKEAAALDPTGPWPLDIRGSKEIFRRLRDSRAVQIALDLRDLDRAVAVAKAAAAAGARFIEVGDPLIKTVGVAAIEHVKQAVPHIAVVAEMMSADWGRDQVILAAEAGADVVLLIGPASTASVSAAVEASTRLGLPLLLDVPQGRGDQSWVHAMERAGVDGFAITTNIDLGVAGPHPLQQARTLRSWTRLPVAVSGGFGIADEVVHTDPSWDILIVGRSVTDAVDPTAAATQLINHINARQPRTAE